MICHPWLASLGDRVYDAQMSYSGANINSLANAINVYDVMMSRRIFVGLTPTYLALGPTVLGIVPLTLMKKCGCSTLLSDSTGIEGCPNRRLKA